MKHKVAFFLSLLFITLCLVAQMWAGTVIVSTTSYRNADEENVAFVALPHVGAWQFDLVANSTPTLTGSFDTLALYMQQEGISGELYTIVNSTFATCSFKCFKRVNPDVYLGGNIRARWTITSGSVTFTVTAREVLP